ncbi:MAG TPA: GH1 family beta-glucosidase [Polyangiaceae bacterium]|nr:GH1 family beta-glucosidase [Polyangiaceae bacterium]
MTFPDDFVWGAAAASYQLEGAANEDGKGPSVWDMFCRKEKAVFAGHTGEVACDHYHRYEEDVALMREMALKAYRLSICWPRVLPEGVGRINPKGLEFYDRLIDTLLENGVEPYVTLFHWDYPLSLYQRGGWLNPDSPSWFAEYADVIGRRLSDRVSWWMTHNEPQCFTLLGHQNGLHAPGDKLELSQVLLATHHALLAHGKGTQALRAAARRPLKIGYAPVGNASIPESDSERDLRAAHDHMFACDGSSLWINSWWMDPVFLGKYPEDGLKVWEAKLPSIGPDDLATIHQPLDFFGTNTYFGVTVRADKDDKPEVLPAPPGAPTNALGWPLAPEALYWSPRRFWERYRKPIVVTENGITVRDFVALDGKVHDPQRIDFISRYLRSLHRAISEGIPVLGYFHWSVMDNFEWAEGFKERFGLIHVDYATQKRTLKDSAYFYKDVIASNGQAALG